MRQGWEGLVAACANIVSVLQISLRVHQAAELRNAGMTQQACPNAPRTSFRLQPDAAADCTTILAGA